MDTNETRKEDKQYASWSHIVTCYDIDKNSFLKQRQLPKITDKHIYPNLIPKMKVKFATQVLSKTVSNFIDLLLNLSNGKTVHYINTQKCFVIYIYIFLFIFFYL